MNLTLALDLLLVVLLLATIVYAMVLHRRLASLRSEKEGLEVFLERMSQATTKADASLKGLRQTAEEARSVLDEPVTKAQALRDELLFLVERGDATAERLAEVSGGLAAAASTGAQSGGASQGPSEPVRRTAAPAKPSRRQTAEAEDETGDGVRSQAERDLMNALRNVR